MRLVPARILQAICRSKSFRMYRPSIRIVDNRRINRFTLRARLFVQLARHENTRFAVNGRVTSLRLRETFKQAYPAVDYRSL